MKIQDVRRLILMKELIPRDRDSSAQSLSAPEDNVSSNSENRSRTVEAISDITPEIKRLVDRENKIIPL